MKPQTACDCAVCKHLAEQEAILKELTERVKRLEVVRQIAQKKHPSPL